MYCDVIIGYPMLHHLNTVMNVKDKRVSIQLVGNMRYDLHMLDRVTESPVMQAAAPFTKDSDSLYDSPICYDSSLNAYEIDTDQDTTHSSASNSKDKPALSDPTSDNDSQSRLEE